MSVLFLFGGEPSFGKKSVTLHLSLHDLMDGFTMLRLCYTCTICAVLKISNRKTSWLFYLSLSKLPIQRIWCCFLNKNRWQDRSVVEYLHKDWKVSASFCHGILLWRWALHIHLAPAAYISIMLLRLVKQGANA